MHKQIESNNLFLDKTQRKMTQIEVGTATDTPLKKKEQQHNWKKNTEQQQMQVYRQQALNQCERKDIPKKKTPNKTVT